MRIFTREHLLHDEEEAVSAGFVEYNLAQGFSSIRLPIALTAYGEELMGALDGYIFFDCLNVSRLWVAQAYRSQGVGSSLMQEAQRRASALGCLAAVLSTYDFQAKPFYEKLGYTLMGVLEDNPKGRCRYFMKKRLQA